jgi:PAS domain S-box-containing protein
MPRRKRDRQSDHSAGPTRARTGRPSRDEIILPLAVEVGRIGIFETEFKRKRTRFSPELCGLLGLPIGTVMSYAESSCIIHEDDRARVQAEVDKAVHSLNLGHWAAECRVRRSDGAVRWVAITGRRIYRQTATGLRPIRSVGTVVDITHLKEAEGALRESERKRLANDRSFLA